MPCSAPSAGCVNYHELEARVRGAMAIHKDTLAADEYFRLTGQHLEAEEPPEEEEAAPVYGPGMGRSRHGSVRIDRSETYQ